MYSPSWSWSMVSMLGPAHGQWPITRRIFKPGMSQAPNPRRLDISFQVHDLDEPEEALHDRENQKEALHDRENQKPNGEAVSKLRDMPRSFPFSLERDRDEELDQDLDSAFIEPTNRGGVIDIPRTRTWTSIQIPMTRRTNRILHPMSRSKPDLRPLDPPPDGRGFLPLSWLRRT